MQQTRNELRVRGVERFDLGPVAGRQRVDDGGLLRDGQAKLPAGVVEDAVDAVNDAGGQHEDRDRQGDGRHRSGGSAADCG